MKYENTAEGIFIKRENRFVATCLVDGREERVHVKNTGRMEELFVEGAPVVLSKSSSPARKTLYDLVTVERNGRLFNVDSQMPNSLFREGFETGLIHLDGYDENAVLTAEKTFGSSRFDFMIEEEKTGFIEVKGVNLKSGDAALFPDAVTKRGLKHVNELTEAKKEGLDAFLVFIVQFEDALCFRINPGHEYLEDAVRNAAAAGVDVRAYSCSVSADSITVAREIKTVL